MPIRTFTLSMPSELIDIIDRLRGNISRSKAVSCMLSYVCQDENSAKSVIPKPVSYEEYYNLHIKPKPQEKNPETEPPGKSNDISQ